MLPIKFWTSKPQPINEWCAWKLDFIQCLRGHLREFSSKNLFAMTKVPCKLEKYIITAKRPDGTPLVYTYYAIRMQNCRTCLLLASHPCKWQSRSHYRTRTGMDKMSFLARAYGLLVLCASLIQVGDEVANFNIHCVRVNSCLCCDRLATHPAKPTPWAGAEHKQEMFFIQWNYTQYYL